MQEIIFTGDTMQKINAVFFGEHSITSASANHLQIWQRNLLLPMSQKSITSILCPPELILRVLKV